MIRFATLLCLLSLAAPAWAQTGPAVPQMAHYDTWAESFRQTWNVPGMSVAVMKDGRLVYARGFGEANPETGEEVQPTHRFRLASISKPLTSAAAMWLVDRGLLDLDAPAFARLSDLPPLPGATEDPRLADVTVRDLLQHSGGWDRDATGYDPMFDVVDIGAAVGVSGPAGCDEVIRYMRGRPLDFTPGTRYAYSNFGYCALGRVMAAAAGQSYEALMQDFFSEMGVGGMALGRTREEDRLADEVTYVESYGRQCASVFGGPTVPCPYGEFYIEAMDAHGGWVANAPDLLRFVRAIDGRGGDDVLSGSVISAMTARPSLPTWNGTGSWYGFGWSVNTNGHWWHTGALNGTRTFFGRMNYQGLAWVVLVNTWPYQNDGAFISAMDNGMWQQAQATTSWPSHDLFAQFPTAADAAPEPAPLAVTVGPNPTRAHATVTLSLDAPASVRVTVFDALGREVRALYDGRLSAGPHPFSFDTSALPAGTYVVRVDGPEGRTARPLTVLR